MTANDTRLYYTLQEYPSVLAYPVHCYSIGYLFSNALIFNALFYYAIESVQKKGAQCISSEEFAFLMEERKIQLFGQKPDLGEEIEGVYKLALQKMSLVDLRVKKDDTNLDAWVKRQKSEVFRESMALIGGKVLGEVSFTKEETRGLNLTGVNLETISCYQYALVKAKDERLYPFANVFFPLKTFIHKLNSCGWANVTHPESGDLVLFIREHEVVHLGISRGEEGVESKLGSDQPAVSLASVKATLSYYQCTVAVYYRKL